MMWGWGYGGWAGWLVGALMMIVFWGGIVWLAVYLFRGWGRSPDRAEEHRGPDAREILAERFARGEISVEEFDERRRVLEPQRR